MGVLAWLHVSLTMALTVADCFMSFKSSHAAPLLTLKIAVCINVIFYAIRCGGQMYLNLFMKRVCIAHSSTSYATRDVC